MKFEFIGIPSGDGESFILKVTPEVFKEITNQEPQDDDYNQTFKIDENGNWTGELEKTDDLCKLYPDILFNYEYEKKYKIKIEIEEI